MAHIIDNLLKQIANAEKNQWYTSGVRKKNRCVILIRLAEILCQQEAAVLAEFSDKSRHNAANIPQYLRNRLAVAKEALIALQARSVQGQRLALIGSESPDSRALVPVGQVVAAASAAENTMSQDKALQIQDFLKTVSIKGTWDTETVAALYPAYFAIISSVPRALAITADGEESTGPLVIEGSVGSAFRDAGECFEALVVQVLQSAHSAVTTAAIQQHFPSASGQQRREAPVPSPLLQRLLQFTRQPFTFEFPGLGWQRIAMLGFNVQIATPNLEWYLRKIVAVAQGASTEELSVNYAIESCLHDDLIKYFRADNQYWEDMFTSVYGCESLQCFRSTPHDMERWNQETAQAFLRAFKEKILSYMDKKEAVRNNIQHVNNLRGKELLAILIKAGYSPAWDTALVDYCTTYTDSGNFLTEEGMRYLLLSALAHDNATVDEVATLQAAELILKRDIPFATIQKIMKQMSSSPAVVEAPAAESAPLTWSTETMVTCLLGSLVSVASQVTTVPGQPIRSTVRQREALKILSHLTLVLAAAEPTDQRFQQDMITAAQLYSGLALLHQHCQMQIFPIDGALSDDMRRVVVDEVMRIACAGSGRNFVAVSPSVQDLNTALLLQLTKEFVDDFVSGDSVVSSLISGFQSHPVLTGFVESLCVQAGASMADVSRPALLDGSDGSALATQGMFAKPSVLSDMAQAARVLRRHFEETLEVNLRVCQPRLTKQ